MADQNQKDFVTICTACSGGLTREELKYVNGKAFHSECYDKFGKQFSVLNEDLLRKNADAKIELVQLRNLKNRTNPTSKGKSSNRPAKRKSKSRKKKSKKRVTKKRVIRKSKKKSSKTKKRRISKKKKARKKSRR